MKLPPYRGGDPELQTLFRLIDEKLTEIYSKAGKFSPYVDEEFSNHIIDTYTREVSSSVSARGVAISAVTSGTFNDGSAMWVDVPNVTVQIVVSGRPVYLSLIGDHIGTETPGVTSSHMYVAFHRSGPGGDSRLNTGLLEITANAGTNGLFVPASSVHDVDIVPAGTYVYKLQIKSSNLAGAIAQVQDVKMVAWEL